MHPFTAVVVVVTIQCIRLSFAFTSQFRTPSVLLNAPGCQERILVHQHRQHHADQRTTIRRRKRRSLSSYTTCLPLSKDPLLSKDQQCLQERVDHAATEGPPAGPAAVSEAHQDPLLLASIDITTPAIAAGIETKRRTIEEGTAETADMGIEKVSEDAVAAVNNSNKERTTGSTILLTNKQDLNADQQQPNNYDDPSYKTLLIFVITTVIIWLSEPLLSLVDTTVVGWSTGSSSAVTQLASLGPATTLTDSLLYSTYGLSIATTNRIATERAIPNNERQLQRTVSHVLGIAIVLGSMCTLICWSMAYPILRKMAGGAGTIELLHYATTYTKIRSAVAIAAVGGVTLQSICLAQQNVRTPALAVLAASLTNLVGDILLRKQGVIGAATILFRSVRRQFFSWRAKDAEGDTVIPLVSLPDRLAAWKLLKLAGPYVCWIEAEYMCFLCLFDAYKLTISIVVVVLICSIFFVIIAKIFCYGAMTLRCTEFGVEALAAQSILMRVFFFFACFGDAFSQTAQSFLPATLYPAPNRPAFAKIFRKLLWLAAIGGLVNSQASTFILQRLSGYVTSDLGIIGIMQSHARHVGIALFFHAFIMLLEGVVLASRDFTSLIATYSITVTMHYLMLQRMCGSFTGVWQTFVMFHRLSLYAWRVVAKQDRFHNRSQRPPQQPDESTTAIVV
jgi:Na+-driven multidrug efflux pump